jgi:hypothetical protein
LGTLSINEQEEIDMSVLGNVFGTTGIVGGQTIASGGNAAQNVAYNQANAMGMANSMPGPLVATQNHIGPSIVSKVRSTEINFTVIQAHNGYMVTSRDYDTDTQDRYVAATVEEVKDLVASILVQRKLGS